jgi:tetratricopeptide (TPR) repeat protein
LSSFVARLCAGAAFGLAACSISFADPASFEIASRDGQRAVQRGQYVDAANRLEAALRSAAHFGETDPRNIGVLNDLGRVYALQGRYSEAEALFRRAVAGSAQSRGAWDPVLAASLSNLADLYRTQGRHDDAEPLYRRALAIRERSYGAEHLSVAEALHNLAETRRVQGDVGEAERLYWRSVMIRSWLQGAAHPALWPTYKGLGDVNSALGRRAEAQQLYSRASGIAEKALPASLSRARLHDFAVGDSETAATARGSSVSLMLMPGTSLSERELLQATEHPEVARQLEGLADIYRAQGRIIEAIDLLRRVLPIREKVFGPGHPEVARAYHVMTSLLALQRDEPVHAAQNAPDPAPRPAAPR